MISYRSANSYKGAAYKSFVPAAEYGTSAQPYRLGNASIIFGADSTGDGEAPLDPRRLAGKASAVLQLLRRLREDERYCFGGGDTLRAVVTGYIARHAKRFRFVPDVQHEVFDSLSYETGPSSSSSSSSSRDDDRDGEGVGGAAREASWVGRMVCDKLSEAQAYWSDRLARSESLLIKRGIRHAYMSACPSLTLTLTELGASSTDDAEVKHLTGLLLPEVQAVIVASQEDGANGGMGGGGGEIGRAHV